MRGRPMQGRTLGTVSGGCIIACVSAAALREIWFGQEDFLLRAPVTEEGYILPENYVKVFENDGPVLVLDLQNGVDDIVQLTSKDVFGYMADQPARWGTWRIYRGGPRGLWITFEDETEEGL